MHDLENSWVILLMRVQGGGRIFTTFKTLGVGKALKVGAMAGI